MEDYIDFETLKDILIDENIILVDKDCIGSVRLPIVLIDYVEEKYNIIKEEERED